MENGDKHWAQKYLMDPLNGPVPSDETGLGSSFKRPDSTTSPTSSGVKSSSGSTKSPTIRVEEQTTGGSTNPFRKDSTSSKKNGVITETRELLRPDSSNAPRSSRSSGGPRREAGHRRIISANIDELPSRRSADEPRDKMAPNLGRPRRASSLSQRYPGDTSHRPLHILERENKLANRAPHLRRKHQPKADSIDHLDDTISSYHHEGPYDAALFVRNTSFNNSPVAALSRSNSEALKATPKDKIDDSLNDHYPLDGVAMVPPGVPDKFGRVYHYEEGTDMQREAGGDYKRWPGVDYLPEDLKGKGEPSYSIEKALKEGKEKRFADGEGNTFELAERPKHSSSRRSQGGSNADGSTSTGQSYSQWEEERRKSHNRNTSGDLRKRVPVGSKRQEA